MADNLMMVPKDQFLSWSMISARAGNWRNRAGCTPYSFFQARNALYFSMDVLRMKPRSHVLAPAYICRAAADPLTAWGVNVEFYAVKSDCSIDLDDLERRITPDTGAILMVHYFGFPQPLAGLRRLCDQYGIALIEDCAHVLTGEVEGRAMGSVGDVSVFSWRKFLPTYDGADLFVNRPKESPVMHWKGESALFTVRIVVNMLETSLSRTSNPVSRIAYRTLRGAESVFRIGAKRYLQASPIMQASDVSFALDEVNRPMSRFSRWTLDHSKITAAIDRRRRNYMTLFKALESLDWVRPLFVQLPSTVSPWVFPVRFDGVRDAHLLLRNKGIPAVTWGGVRPPSVQRRAFPDADDLYDNLVFLPIHQCLSDRNLFDIVRVIREVK